MFIMNPVRHEFGVPILRPGSGRDRWTCLTHVPIKAQRAQGQNVDKIKMLLEPIPDISELKDRIRQIVWSARLRIRDVIKYSHEKPVVRRLEKLLAAQNRSA
jgi:hypothetical protein